MLAAMVLGSPKRPTKFYFAPSYAPQCPHSSPHRRVCLPTIDYEVQYCSVTAAFNIDVYHVLSLKSDGGSHAAVPSFFTPKRDLVSSKLSDLFF
jgi:hypothetical protein